jgi:uncharacterized phage infection (PIP) family protein YhgE
MASLGKLETVTQDRGLQNQIMALNQTATTLVETSAELKTQLNIMMTSELCAGVNWSDLFKELDKLDERLAKVLAKLETSPGEINDGRAWPPFESLAHKVAKDLRDTLKIEWNAFVTSKTLNRITVFSAFSDLAQCREAIKELESLEGKAKSRLNTLPNTLEDITFIIEIDEEMTDLIGGLGIGDEPTEMIEFLKRCASVNGVPLSELSDERLAWLRLKGFEESLRIRG